MENYEVLESKSGHYIAKVNNCLLHSQYDPKEEANLMAKKNEKAIIANNQIILLGLGLGHHLFEIINICEKHHKQYKILVIDPCLKNLESINEFHPFQNENVKILINEDSTWFFSNEEFISFLLNGPQILFHPGSLNVFRSFFSKFLNFTCPQLLTTISKGIENDKLKKYLHEIGNIEYKDYVETLKKKDVIKNYDYLILALNSLRKQKGLSV